MKDVASWQQYIQQNIHLDEIAIASSVRVSSAPAPAAADVILCSDGLRRHPRLQSPASDVLLAVRMTVISSPAMAAFYVLHVSSAPAAMATDVAPLSSAPVWCRSHELCSGIGSHRRHPLQ
jgi:hypothetical protein